MRYLLVLGLIVVGVLLWRRAMRSAAPPTSAPPPERAAEAMVQCRVCGVYLPQPESLQEGPFHYCCEAHRNQDRAR